MKTIQQALQVVAERIQNKEGPSIDYSFQELGVEMEKEFKEELGEKVKKNVWPTFYKYKEGDIRDAWLAYQKGRVKKWRYFMGILNRKSGKEKKGGFLTNKLLGK